MRTRWDNHKIVTDAHMFSLSLLQLQTTHISSWLRAKRLKFHKKKAVILTNLHSPDVDGQNRNKQHHLKIKVWYQTNNGKETELLKRKIDYQWDCLENDKTPSWLTEPLKFDVTFPQQLTFRAIALRRHFPIRLRRLRFERQPFVRALTKGYPLSAR